MKFQLYFPENSAGHLNYILSAPKLTDIFQQQHVVFSALCQTGSWALQVAFPVSLTPVAGCLWVFPSWKLWLWHHVEPEYALPGQVF